MTTEQREEYAKLHKDCGDVITLAATAKRAITPEEKAAQDLRYARMDVLRAQNEDEKRLAALAFSAGTTGTGKSAAQLEIERLELANGTSAGAAGAAGAFNQAGAAVTYGEKPLTDAQKFAFRASANRFLRTGEVDNFTITTTGNAILVPTAVMPPETIRRNYNAFRAILAATGYQPMATTGTEQMVLPIFDDTGVVGDTPAQNATSANSADFATTGSVTLGATLYSSKQRWFSNTVLNANGFDILAYITPIVQKSVDKTQEAAFTATLIATAAGTYTNNHYSAATYIDILNWEHTLNVAYRSDAAFAVADTFYRVIRGLVDNNNRPIMDLDPTNVFQSRLHNKPIFVSDFLAPMGTASNIPGAFLSGDAIKMRDVVPQRLARFVNVPQYPDQTGYQLFANGDCQFVPNGVALFKLNATTT